MNLNEKNFEMLNHCKKNNLIKLIDLRSFKKQHLTIEPIHFSEFLINEINKNVIEHFNWNDVANNLRKNLISIFIDTNLLDRMCLDTILKSTLVSKSTLILPVYRIRNSLNAALNEWKLTNPNEWTLNKTNSPCIRYYFDAYNKIIEYFSLEEVLEPRFCELVTYLDLKSNKLDYCSKKTLKELIRLFDAILKNYTAVLGQIRVPNINKQTDQLRLDLIEMMNSVDLYFMTCLLFDLFIYLQSYHDYSRKMSIEFDSEQFEWLHKGSAMYNGFNEERLNMSIVNTPSKVAKLSESQTAFGKEFLEELNNTKSALEKKLCEILDYNCENKSNYDKYRYLSSIKKDSFDLIKIYTTLGRMFDIKFNQIVSHAGTLELSNWYQI